MTPTRTEVVSPPAIYNGGPLPLTAEARKQFTQETIELLASKFGLSAGVASVPSALLYATCELAARYGLDPFNNEIWLAKMGGRDGGGGQLAIMVGRDGYMKVANRDRAFISCAGQAVYEHDELEVEIDETGGLSHFRFKAAHPARRGEPTGAFAILRRRGDYSPLYFFAPLQQFKKSGGAWKYEDAMIVKCAQSYLLRTTYNVTGAVPHDEVSVGFSPQPHDAEGSATEEQPAVLPQELELLLDRAIALDPKSWRRNEVEARVLSASGEVLPDEARKVARDVRDWLEGEGVDVESIDGQPAREDEDRASGQAAREAEEEPVDAEVVEESAAPTLAWTMPPESVLAKWEAEPDSEWRQHVERLLERRDELERAEPETDQHAADVAAELDAIGDELEGKRGVPRGWRPPPAPGQDSLL